MLHRAPRTRKLRPCVFHLAEWAPEAVMILLAASHKFFIRKDVRYFIWFELIKSVSFWKVFRRTSPEITMLLFCFWPDVQLLKKIPTPTRCKTFCNMATERSMVVYFVVTYWQFLLQSRSSDSIEQYNEPPRYRLHRNFAKSLFVLQIYQTDARHEGFRLTNFSERHWRNDWRETLFDSQDIISGLRWTYLCCIVL